MSNEDPIDLDEYLTSGSFDVLEEKLKLYEAILGALLRKYVPVKRKVEVNLIKASNDTILDVTLDANGMAKISWGEDANS